MRNKQVVLLIAGISGIATGIIVSLNIPFIRQGLFYPASPVEIVVSLCLTFSVSVVFFVGAIVGWISVSENLTVFSRWGRKRRTRPYCSTISS
nr:conjugal transfer protein TrbJ [Escherichia coli]